MRQTTNYNLSLYDTEDNFSITAEENSLNANMEIIDNALKEKISGNDLQEYMKSTEFSNAVKACFELVEEGTY